MDGIIVQGRLENVFNHEDFARLLEEKLGRDAAVYFRDVLKDTRREVSDYYESVLYNCGEILGDWDLDHMTCLELKEAREELLDMIHDSYSIVRWRI